MIANYLGTLKAWIYRPLFYWFGIGTRVTRTPMLLAGVASLWFCYLFLLRVAGKRAAFVGCGLLATDSLYLLCTCFDWGPVALQHLLLLGGLWLLVRFWQERDDRLLCAGFFLWGLALWDKAVAIWSLTGFGIAALVTLLPQIRQVWSARRLTTAVAGFALGALPLIAYNVDSRLGTLQGTAVYDATSVPRKTAILIGTFAGDGLFNWMTVADQVTEHPHPPAGWLQIASAKVAALVGHPHKGLLLYAFIGALLLTPFTRGTDLRLIGFALITMAVAWCQMVFTAGAGTGVHHSILLWPLPQIAIATSFAAASRRLGRWGNPILATVLVVLLGANLAVMNQYFADMVRNGGALNWTDAIDRLSDYLKRVPASNVAAIDWGIVDSLRLLNHGKLPLRILELSSSEPSPTEVQDMGRFLAVPGIVFVAHAPGREFHAGSDAKLLKFAESTGYQRQMLAVLEDSWRRPTFEVYRFVHEH